MNNKKASLFNKTMRILSGKGFPRPFVDATLEQLGVEYVD